MNKSYHIKTYNEIAKNGLSEFDAKRIVLNQAVPPDAILCRSYALEQGDIFSNTLAVSRAGAGVNNIPVPFLSQTGVPVFNTPGANANAVKELVFGALIMAKRHLSSAHAFACEAQANATDLMQRIEQGKKAFNGSELYGTTLGVVGLGAIGVQVANAALALGMQVIGYDPHISVQHSWQLSAQVRRATSLSDLCQQVDVLTLHVPLLPDTHHLIEASLLAKLPAHAVVLNFARAELVDTKAMLGALKLNKIARYACDFPDAIWHHSSRVLCFPHCGASTKEATVQCAKMAARQLQRYLFDGSVINSVNFPHMDLSPVARPRVAIVHHNQPTMVSQISQAIGQAQLNIEQLHNRSRENIAYTVMDLSASVSDALMRDLHQIDGVQRVRYWQP